MLSLSVVLALALPRGADGHAVPRSASPAADATVATGPPEVSIRFSERVERGASALEVLDASGRRVDRGDARVDGGDPWLFRVTVPDLPPDVYTVSWRVLSADDGHLTEGAHGFVVGEGATAGRPAPARVRAVTPPLLPVGRWLALAGLLTVLGIATFGPWLGSAPGAARAQRVTLLAGLTLIALGEGLRLAALLRQTTAASFLATAAGRVGAVELGLTLALAALALAGPRDGVGRLLTVGLATTLLVAGAFAGHGAAVQPAFLAVTAHALHLVALAAWVGGLGYFATLFWASRRDDERLPALATALPRFSLAATGAVGGLALTGLYLARVHLGGPRELITTPYGAVLLAKLGVVGLMLALAAYHRFVVQRRLALTPDPDVAARFRQTLRVESGAGLVALLLGAILGTTAPPPPAAASEPPRFRRHFTGDGATVALEAWPLRPGHNSVSVRVADPAGQPLTDARTALLQLTPAGAGVGPSALTLEPAGPGRFESGHVLLGLAGPWRGRLVIQRQDAFDLNHTFELRVGAGAAVGPTPRGLDATTGLVALAIVVATALLLLDARRQLQLVTRTAANPAAQEISR